MLGGGSQKDQRETPAKVQAKGIQVLENCLECDDALLVPDLGFEHLCPSLYENRIIVITWGPNTKTKTKRNKWCRLSCISSHGQDLIDTSGTYTALN